MLIPISLDIFGDITIEDLLLIFFCVAVGVIFLSIVAAIAKSSENRKNDAQPVRKGIAKLVEKPNTDNVAVVFSGWLMFELENGERVRLNLKGTEFLNLVEGDVGHLTWQGTRFLGFSRNTVGR